MSKVYILYDERAITGDTEDASILEVQSKAPTEKAAIERFKLNQEGCHGAIYSYDAIGEELVNEQFVATL